MIWINNAKETYEKALESGGFTEKLTFIQPNEQSQNNRESKKIRKRKIIWFNPPFYLNVKTDVGKLFFKILGKDFLKTNPLSKIFNKNTVKISYSCTRNMKSIYQVITNNCCIQNQKQKDTTVETKIPVHLIINVWGKSNLSSWFHQWHWWHV